MNFKIFLSVIALAVTVTSITAPSAQAEEGGGGGGNARWKFAPNVYRLEQATGPRQHAFSEPPMQQVRRGATPGVANMLGFNPAQLKKPVAAQVPVQPQQNVMAQLGVPNFNNLFGKPTGNATTATAIPLPLTAQMPKAGVLAPSKPAAVRAPIRHLASNNSNVAGRLRRPAHAQSRMASAGPIQSYGNQGYVPGSTAPGIPSGSVARTDTSVMGVIKQRH